MSDASCDPDAEAVEEMLHFLDTMDRDVSSWEAEFLDSVMKQRRAGGTLSPKQREKLEEMYEKYTNEQEFHDKCEDDS